jgi:hypothetical protein
MPSELNDRAVRGRIVSFRRGLRCIEIQLGCLSRRTVAGDRCAVNDVMGS